MAIVEPVSLRFVLPELTGEVPSPPHDALSAAARRQHLIDHPRSYLGVTRSPEDIDPGSADPAGDALRAGRRQLESMLQQGVFSPSSDSGFFIYRLELDGHRQTGLVCGVATADYDDGTVRIHERINQGRAAHLANHLRVVGAQSSPIALAYKSRPAVADVIEAAIEANEAILDFVDENGLRQRLWPIPEASDIEKLRLSFANAPLYLIDGHHRAAAASADRADLAPHRQRHHLMLATLFPYEELRNQAFHRVLTGIDRATFEAELVGRFPVRFTDDPEVVAGRAQTEVAFGVPRSPGMAPPLAGQEPANDGLDGPIRWLLVDVPFDIHARSDLNNIDPVRLGNQILGPVLDIDEATSDPRLSYRPGWADAESISAIAVGPDESVFLMRPVPMDVLMDASDEGLVMPPKSTYFMPKVRSGLFLRVVDKSLG
ncbi:MAG: DUF1015 family protein [Acidimicrobiales bacterium]